MTNSQLSYSVDTKYLLLVIVVFLLNTSLLAQRSNELDFIVLYNGDTLYGNVQYIDEGVPRKFYKKIRLLNQDGKVHKFKKRDIASFRINNIDYESFWLREVSQKFNLFDTKYAIDDDKGEQYFLKVVSKGNLEHYQLEWFEQGEATLWSMSLLKKREETYFLRADQGVIKLKRKVLLEYLSNCSKIIEAINQKQVNNVRELVDFYDNHCEY